MSTLASTPMPLYRCHKEVWALKIKALKIEAIELIADAVIITPEEVGYAPFSVDAAYVTKHQPRVGGYYVIYKDGYKSFSPAQAFEEGYSRV